MGKKTNKIIKDIEEAILSKKLFSGAQIRGLKDLEETKEAAQATTLLAYKDLIKRDIIESIRGQDGGYFVTYRAYENVISSRMKEITNKTNKLIELGVDEHLIWTKFKRGILREMLKDEKEKSKER